MQLAITALGKNTICSLNDILSVINNCGCSIVELKTSNLSRASSLYLLSEGDWSQIAKLEHLLESLSDRQEIQIQTFRPIVDERISNEGIPYKLETVSLFRHDIVQDLITFLHSRNIYVEEVFANRYQAAYFQSPVFSTKFIISIPAEIRILSFREEILDFCDNLNLDAIIEPIKH